MSEPIRVGEILGAWPELAGRLGAARVLSAWPAIAGAAAARSRAEAIENGCLEVVVDSPVWLHHLTLESAALLTRCQRVADVRAIRFRLGPLDPAPDGPTGRPGGWP